MYGKNQCARKYKIVQFSKRETMKKIILINFFTLLFTMVFATIIHGQQRPSQRSFASVMNQVKQKQLARDKMLQQIKQATPSNNAAQNVIELRPSAGNPPQQAAQQRSQTVPKTKQPVINKQQVEVKKE